MNLGQSLVEYGAVGVDQLRGPMLQLPKEFWEVDKSSRVSLAGDRPGNAVFFYNDSPPFVSRKPMAEARTGQLSVYRCPDRPLFAEIRDLIEAEVQPHFPDCDVMRVQLAELPPGAVITPHRDIGILSLIHRMHVPLVTHEQVSFIINGQRFFLAEGNLYDLNNAVVHSVENKSDVMRVHLMIDMLPHAVARARYFDTQDEMLAACAPFAPATN